MLKNQNQTNNNTKTINSLVYIRNTLDLPNKKNIIMSQPHNESNDYSFMLQSIEKKLTSTITAQVNEYYKKTTNPTASAVSSSRQKRTSTRENLSPKGINQSNNTIELPSQILGLNSPPNTAGNVVPFIDHSLSSIQMTHPASSASSSSILKKRRISHDSILNSDDSTFLYHPDDPTGEIDPHVTVPPRIVTASHSHSHSHTTHAGNNAPFSRTITLQSQIDELKIINETQKEQIKFLKLELENTKETSIKQLTFLDTQNKKYKQEIEEKTNKYYEDKKKWQLKVKEIEQQYQKKSAAADGNGGGNSNNSNNNNNASNQSHYTQYIQELQQQVQSINQLLTEKLNENETLLQQKITFEKKVILLENDLKTMKLQLQYSTASAATAGGVAGMGGEEQKITKEQLHQLQDKFLEEKLSYQKQIQSLEKQLQQKNQDTLKVKDQLKNQLLLEEQINQLQNEKLLFTEKKEEYLEMERKYYSLIEEKKHWMSIFTKIQHLLLANNNNNNMNNTSFQSNGGSVSANATFSGEPLDGGDNRSGLSYSKILTVIQSLQEKYSLLLNENGLLQSKQQELMNTLRKKEQDWSELSHQHQRLKQELEKRDTNANQSSHQLKSYEREIHSLRELLQTYDLEFSLNHGVKNKTIGGGASHQTVTEKTMMTLKNELIEKLQSELDEVRKQYAQFKQQFEQLQKDHQQLQQEKEILLVQREQQQQQLQQTDQPTQTSQQKEESGKHSSEEEESTLNEWQQKYDELMNNYQTLQQVSGIDYLPHKTKILRLIDNPTMTNDLSLSTSSSSSTFPPDQLQYFKQENKRLTAEIQQLKENQQQHQLQASSALNLSDENIPTAGHSSSVGTTSSAADPSKYNQRLKELFREKIQTLRHGMYLLTGYMVELTVTESLPRFKLKSMYAENADDFLLFQMDGDKLELLESEYALSLDEGIMKYLKLYNSFPGFLANLTLQLFENQTCMT